MSTTKPLVVLIGRPNVGKSTLFNRLIRGRRALTHDRPGVTRDRMYGVVRRAGVRFDIADTGGIDLDDAGQAQSGAQGLRGFEQEVLEQARAAMDEARVIGLVVDGREGLTPLDARLARFVRQSNKPVLLVVNKVDGAEQEDLLLSEFYSLGLPMLAVSGEHGHQVENLAARLHELLGEGAEARHDEEDKPLRLAMLGRPNAGKSSLVNALVGEERMIVSEIAGTTRDSIDVTIEIPLPRQAPLADATGAPDAEGHDDDYDDAEYDDAEYDDGEPYPQVDWEDGGCEDECAAAGPEHAKDAEDAEDEELEDSPEDYSDAFAEPELQPSLSLDEDAPAVDAMELVPTRFTFVDTAGVRRRTRIDDPVERFSVQAALSSVRRADVTFYVIDALEGVTAQDKKLLAYLDREKLPFVLLVNKVDLVARKERPGMEKRFREELAICSHVPVVFVSALKGTRLRELLPLARRVWQECGVRIPTGRLNRMLQEVLSTHQPPVVKRRRAKFYYLTQSATHPPTFVFFVNDAERVLPSYARYLENRLRALLGIKLAPMAVHFRVSGQRWGMREHDKSKGTDKRSKRPEKGQRHDIRPEHLSEQRPRPKSAPKDSKGRESGADRPSRPGAKPASRPDAKPGGKSRPATKPTSGPRGRSDDKRGSSPRRKDSGRPKGKTRGGAR